MTPISSLPDFDWNEIARREISMTGEELISQSTVAFKVQNVAAGGLIYHNFMTPPWFWFILARNVTMRHLIDFRRHKEHIPVGALTAVDEDEPLARRFAVFYGFEPTEELRSYHGHQYRIFRRA
jgi:hypothetical protein